MSRNEYSDNAEECRSGIFKDKDGCRRCRMAYHVFSLKEEQTIYHISVARYCVTRVVATIGFQLCPGIFWLAPAGNRNCTVGQ